MCEVGLREGPVQTTEAFVQSLLMVCSLLTVSSAINEVDTVLAGEVFTLHYSQSLRLIGPEVSPRTAVHEPRGLVG
jgi:hypothetical protein